MTPEGQRIAIAEACGFYKGFFSNGPGGVLYGEYPCGDDAARGPVPNYLNDLNAMHEAEKVLTEEQKWDYLEKLSDIVYPKDIPEIGKRMCQADWNNATATAAQRAEAFLKTIGKWVES